MNEKEPTCSQLSNQFVTLGFPVSKTRWKEYLMSNTGMTTHQFPLYKVIVHEGQLLKGLGLEVCSIPTTLKNSLSRVQKKNLIRNREDSNDGGGR